MKAHLHLLAVVSLNFIVQVLPLHAQQIVFNPVAPQEGTLKGLVTGITQDAHGYMWFAATGLHRYDGYQFTSYFHNPSNPGSLVTNRLESVYTDRNGIIWVGTFGAGLDRFDPATEIFTHFTNKANDSTTLSNNYCTEILEDLEGFIWVGTNDGLNRLDQKTGKFIRYQQKANDTTSLSNNQVRALYEDRQGTIWVGTGDGTLPGEGGLNRLDKKSGTFTRYMHNPKDIYSLIDNKVRAIYEDSRGNFWVGTYGDGLHTMDRTKGIFFRQLYDPAHPEKLSRPYLKRRRTMDGVTFIHEDITGIIWIGSNEGGLNLYNPKTELVTHYEGRQQPDSLFEDGTRSIYSSRDGVIWMSTLDDNIYSLYRINPFQKRIPHYALPEGTVNAFVDEPGNILWIGSVKGLLRYDRTKGSMSRFVNDPNDPSSLSHNIINSITKDREGNIWIGTNKGLNLLNPDKQTFTRFLHDSKNNNSLIFDYIITTYEDTESNLWLGTAKGLDRMNLKTGKFTHYVVDAADTRNFGKNAIVGIYQDGWKKLWVGSNGNGLLQLDQKTGKFKEYLNGRDITKIYQDTDSMLWLGSADGLFRYNRAIDSFFLFEDPGFTKKLKDVFNILEDDHKNLWLSASDGIMRINAKRNETSLYGVKYGIPGFTDIRFWSGYKGQKGELFFGNSTGYYSFFPDEFTRNSKPPQINISGFSLADQIVKPTKNGPLFQPLSEVKEIRLKYNQDVFSFDFAGIYYSSPEENLHFFKLEGYNNVWRQSGAERTAYYFNVPPGNYVFRVKTANSDGLWAEKSIKIIITPPWWKTWWAYCIYGLLLIAVVFAIHHIQKKRVIVAERKRTRERELAQAKEIERAYTELKTTQAQLIQSEKMASLGELTAGIAHEIQNPLNFVNNFSEVNSELIAEMKQEIGKGNIREVKIIANNIDENEQKIIFHGKRADAIVKGMLQHSRSSSGVKEPTNINVLADEYFRLAYHGLRAKDKSFNATMRTDFDETIGNINIVPQDIGRVVLNLITNAFYAVTERKNQAGDNYEPIVSVSTKKTNGKVEIKVKDNGNGIPQKVLDKIFQPFFTTKPTGQGTGLGLSLSYDIIKAHSGELKVETKEGEGAEFIIQLPTN
jgi:signal transduction histidine kinase/ligand-binding sensor domain-containing protein